MFDFFKKNAQIIEANHATGKVETQGGFSSIGQANAASSQIISQQGGIVINREVNDHDGFETDFVSPFKNGIWHQKTHIVIPEE